jgi:dolichyl-phosphate-mannose--protein O-mannosyl transferase
VTTATLPTQPARAETAATGVDAAGQVRERPESLVRWRPDSVLVSWLATGAVGVLAAVLRFWALGFPHEKVFDEVYYATEAQELLRYGYESDPAYMFIVHPPLGKWLIALTSLVWGNNSLGWRIAPAVAGTLCVILTCRLAMRMLRSVVLGVLAGVLLSLDGISLVMSRVALLDIFLQLFVLAGFFALVLDRDQIRGRLGGLYEAGLDLTRSIPPLGPRPWRLAAGVLFGLAFGVKWSALSFWVAFAVLSLSWDRAAFKAVGSYQPIWMTVRRSLRGSIGSLALAGAGAYLLTWTGWFVGENSWNRHWGDTNPGTGLLRFLPSGLRSLANYHHLAYKFHSTLYSPHAYKANPWTWLIMGRPISFYYPTNPGGCGAYKSDGTPDCAREILLIGTPFMYWAIVPAVIWLLWLFVTTRDWRAGAIGMAFIAGWVVWLHDIRRTGFLFYMTPLMPFLIIGLAMAVGALLSPAAEDRTSLVNRLGMRRRSTAQAAEPEPEPAPGAVRSVGMREWIEVKAIPWSRLIRTVLVCAWLGAVVADFIWMWPIFTGGLLTYDEWHARMWLPGWI